MISTHCSPQVMREKLRSDLIHYMQDREIKFTGHLGQEIDKKEVFGLIKRRGMTIEYAGIEWQI